MAMLAMRIQVRHWRFLTWLATVVLVGVAGYNLWQIIQKNRENKYEARSMTHFEQIIGSATGSIDQGAVKVPVFDRDYVRLYTTPINGFIPAPVVKPVEGPKTDEPPPPKPISDVLVVTAVTCAPDDHGRVVVKYKDDAIKPTSKDETVLKVGQVLTPPYDVEPFNARLKAIHSDSAIFDWCGKDVEVHPMRKEEFKVTTAAGDGGVKPKFDSALSEAEKAALARTKENDRTVGFAPDGFVLGKKDIDEWSAKPDDLLKQAGVSEKQDANGKKVVVFGQIRPGSMLGKTYGVQTGDTLVSINGAPVTSRTQAMQYVRENDTLSKYVVVIRHLGKDVTKTILVHRD